MILADEPPQAGELVALQHWLRIMIDDRHWRFPIQRFD
jgi:hypothetical protein